MEEEDQKLLGKVNSKNALEGYLFSVKNSINDKQLEGKIKDEDKKKNIRYIRWWSKMDGIKYRCYKRRLWKKKQKEVEEIVTPIIQKLGGGMGGMGGGGMGGFNPEDFQNFQKENTENKEDKKDDKKYKYKKIHKLKMSDKKNREK